MMTKTGVRAAGRGMPGPPATLLEEVGESCRALTEAASGRVFAVPEDGVESALQSEWASGARYDTILSFVRTPQVDDIERFAAALERILAEEGWIHMVEPAAAGTGPIRRLLAARPGRHWSRREAQTDVVAALRSAGLMVTDLHRREAPSVPAAWRRYVVLRARRETPRRSEP